MPCVTIVLILWLTPAQRFPVCVSSDMLCEAYQILSPIMCASVLRLSGQLKSAEIINNRLFMSHSPNTRSTCALSWTYVIQFSAVTGHTTQGSRLTHMYAYIATNIDIHTAKINTFFLDIKIFFLMSSVQNRRNYIK